MSVYIESLKAEAVAVFLWIMNITSRSQRQVRLQKIKMLENKGIKK